MNLRKVLVEAANSLQPISSSSSSSCDDSDDDRPTRKRVRIQDYVETTVHKYSNAEFKEHFRMKRETVGNIVGAYALTSTKNYKGGWPEISYEKKVLITVWYLANTETYRQIADRFDVSLSSAYEIISDVSQYLVNISPQYIKWPSNDDAKKIAIEFKKRGMPNVLGAIDGTHIQIHKPKTNGDDYINRKGYASILLQGVVNCYKVFIDVSVGAPGSLHDARNLRKSKLFQKAESGELFYNQYYLLGDSAYPSLRWLVPPFKDNGLLTNQQKAFNQKHSSLRIVVEHGFGLLKGRFRRLFNFQNENIKLITKLVVAACVLHNICILENDTGEQFAATENYESNEDHALEEEIETVNRRQQVFNEMFRDS